MLLLAMLPAMAFAAEAEVTAGTMPAEEKGGENGVPEDLACLALSEFLAVAAMANAAISVFFFVYGCTKENKVKEMLSTMRVNQEKTVEMKSKYLPGTLIEMDRMEDTRPIECGERGIVEFVDDIGLIHVKWDSGRIMGVVPGIDLFHVVAPAELRREVNVR